MPKVSVIIPTHNRAKLLALAVNSVMNQTFQDFEIIIIDDASKDNTRGVIRKFADSRIKYIGRETSGGVSIARNEGINNSRCEYVAFLDDDDEWLPQKLKLQILMLERSPLNIGGVYTGRILIDGMSGKSIRTINVGKRGYLFDDLLFGYSLTTSSLLLRKSCFEKAGMFDEAIFFGEDFDLWLRISRDFQWECIEEPLIKYRIHEKKLTMNLDLVIAGKEMFLEKYKQWLEVNPKGYSKWYLKLGIVYCLNGNLREGRLIEDPSPYIRIG